MFHTNTFLPPATPQVNGKKVHAKAFAIQLNIFFCVKIGVWKRIYSDITTIITHVANPLAKWPSWQNLIKSDTQFSSLLCQSFYLINIFFRTIVCEMDAKWNESMLWIVALRSRTLVRCAPRHYKRRSCQNLSHQNPDSIFCAAVFIVVWFQSFSNPNFVVNMLGPFEISENI